MKKALWLLVVLSLGIWLVSCASSRSFDGRGGSGGGGGGSTNFQAGNWAFTTSGGINGPIFMGGQLTTSGSTISGNMFVLGTQGSGFTIGVGTAPMSVTGSASNGTLTLNGAAGASSITMTFTGVKTSGTITSLSNGTYQVSGGTDNTDNGTISGTIAGSFTGTWAGTDSTTGGMMTVQMTEAASANTNGDFTLSPTTGTGITFTGSAGCTVTGTLNNLDSFAAGGIVFLDINTVDNGVNGEVLFAGAADNPTAPSNISNVSFYTYNGGSGCMLQNTNLPVSFVLSKQ